jgi:jumonji domain-containing protein 7
MPLHDDTDARVPRPSTSPTALAVRAALASASADAAAVAPRAVPALACPPDLPAFLRDHVGPRAPALVTGVGAGWGRPPPWTVDDFVSLAGPATRVTVALTPDGRADAVTAAGDFVQPAEVVLSVGELVGELVGESPRRDRVAYAQRQNGSLAEFPGLAAAAAVPASLAWAEAAFGTGPPDAVNVWVGGPRSATAWHRDAYENVAVTLVGVKTYHLLPPGDGWRLGLADRRAARWAWDEGRGAFSLARDGGGDGGPPTRVRWAGAPPPPPHAVPGVDADPAAFPDLYAGGGDGRLPPPLSVAVPAGCALYLPPLWWHAATQAGDSDGGSGACVTVNYWYDMRHDGRWAAARLADETLVGLL